MRRLLHGFINCLTSAPSCNYSSNPVLTALGRHPQAHAAGCFGAAIGKFTPDSSVTDFGTRSQKQGFSENTLVEVAFLNLPPGRLRYLKAECRGDSTKSLWANAARGGCSRSTPGELEADALMARGLSSRYPTHRARSESLDYRNNR